MSDRCEVIKVKPWGAEQGEFVLINASDFDAAIHKKFGEAEPAAEKPAAKRKKA